MASASYVKISEQSLRTLRLANEAARSLKSAEVTTAHLLMGLFQEMNTVAAEVLHDVGVGNDLLCREVKNVVCEGPLLTGAHSPPQSQELVLLLAWATRLGSRFYTPVKSEHLLLTMMQHECLGRTVLDRLGVSPETVLGKMTSMRKELMPMVQ